MKLLREKKRDELIKKMKDGGKLSDDSDDSDDSEDEKNENSQISENSEDEKNEIKIKKIPFDEDNGNDNILSVKDLIYEIHNLNDEIEGLRDILNSTEILLKNSNTQNIELSKEIRNLRLEIKKYDLFEKNNNVDDENDADQEDNNYMDDGEMDEDEEDDIKQQIEDDEQPAIMELRKELNGDKFIIIFIF